METCGERGESRGKSVELVMLFDSHAFYYVTNAQLKVTKTEEKKKHRLIIISRRYVYMCMRVCVCITARILFFFFFSPLSMTLPDVNIVLRDRQRA